MTDLLAGGDAALVPRLPARLNSNPKNRACDITNAACEDANPEAKPAHSLEISL
jgi:hypothetical protein